MLRIYLDNNATTCLDPRVASAMAEHLHTFVANPSSIHFFGQQARGILQKARQTLADYFHAKPHEIIFTSGGTESLSMLMRSFFYSDYHGHILTSSIEHASVYETALFLQKQGCSVTFLSPTPDGKIDPQEVEANLRENTKYVLLSAANSETGVKNDIEAIAKITERRNIPFFVDGVSILGKETFHIPNGVSGMAFSSHKIHGPKGVGATFLRSSLQCPPLILGGGQEYGKRSGTENLLGIVGFAKAIECLTEELPKSTHYMESIRNLLEEGILDSCPDAVVHGTNPRLANTTNISFPNMDGESLLIQLDMQGIAVSHGSACSSGAIEPSRVLLQMGVTRAAARSAVRFSLSRFTTAEEIEKTLSTLKLLMKSSFALKRF